MHHSTVACTDDGLMLQDHNLFTKTATFILERLSHDIGDLEMVFCASGKLTATQWSSCDRPFFQTEAGGLL